MLCACVLSLCDPKLILNFSNTVWVALGSTHTKSRLVIYDFKEFIEKIIIQVFMVKQWNKNQISQKYRIWDEAQY